MTLVTISKIGNKTYYGMYCPACQDPVMIDDGWSFDGNTEAPTFSPSLLTRCDHATNGLKVCHSFIRSGKWEYLSDCTHEYAGKTLPMVDMPEKYLPENPVL